MKSAYDQAATSGRYEGRGALLGKYDHVRIHWEEGFFRRELDHQLRPAAGAAGAPLRVLDLGCGGGDGLAFLRETLDEDLHRPLGSYTGVDIVDSLLDQARERFAESDTVRFRKGDLSQGLPVAADEPAYDLYFASFGTLSHLDTPTTVRLFADIARHGEPGALVVADWLGRFSYEWRDLWTGTLDDDVWMDYRISYIYSPEERARRQIDSFPLRLVAPQEVSALVAAAAERSGRPIEVVAVKDRSLLCGRHIDTGEYNGNPMPLREQLNRLHHDGVDADLDALRVGFPAMDPAAPQDTFFLALATAWNDLVDCAAALIAGDTPEPGGANSATASGREALLAAAREATTTGAQPRPAIESALAFALRDLELALQQGGGNGHGLVAVLRLG